MRAVSRNQLHSSRPRGRLRGSRFFQFGGEIFQRAGSARAENEKGLVARFVAAQRHGGGSSRFRRSGEGETGQCSGGKNCPDHLMRSFGVVISVPREIDITIWRGGRKSKSGAVIPVRHCKSKGGSVFRYCILPCRGGFFSCASAQIHSGMSFMNVLNAEPRVWRKGITEKRNIIFREAAAISHGFAAAFSVFCIRLVTKTGDNSK